MASGSIKNKSIEYFDRRFRNLPSTKVELIQLDKDWKAFAKANPKIAQAYIKKEWGIVELFSMSLLYCDE